MMAMTIFMDLNPRLGPACGKQVQAISTGPSLRGMVAPAANAGRCESSPVPVLRAALNYLKTGELWGRWRAFLRGPGAHRQTSDHCCKFFNHRDRALGFCPPLPQQPLLGHRGYQ